MKKRADGRYVATKVIDGQRKAFYGKTEREVTRKMVEYTRASERGRSFSDVADEWWGEAYDRIAVTTSRGYRIAYKRAVDYFGDEPIRNIRTQDVNAYLVRIARMGLTAKSVMSHKSIMSMIFLRAIEDGEIDNNPVDFARIPKSAAPSKKRPAASVMDEEAIRSATEQNEIFPVPFIALYTGMRLGEILGLQRRDIDFRKEIITVQRSLFYTGGWNLKEPKTEAGKRKIPIFSPLTDFLLKFKDLPPRAFICSEDGGKTHTAPRGYAHWRSTTTRTRTRRSPCTNSGILTRQ